MVKGLFLFIALAVLQAAPASTRILFIGNSLTYANDLPRKVCTLAEAAGRRAVCESVAKPDYSLEDHWNAKQAQRVIARGGRRQRTTTAGRRCLAGGLAG